MNCCPSPQKTQNSIALCPDCGVAGQPVKVRTLKHWLSVQLVPSVPDVAFYFCKTRECPIVYYSDDHSVKYTKGDVRNRIGAKEAVPPLPVCYCFGVTEEMILEEVREKGQSGFSAWIGKEVKAGNCACDVRNPSGNCCLAEVKRVEKMTER